MNDLKGNQPDEFQFKPLTKGLGFHPKKETSVSPASTPTVSKAAAQTSYSNSPGLDRIQDRGLSFKDSEKTLEKRQTLSAGTMEKAKPATPAAKSLRLDTPLPRPETRRTPTPSQSGQAVENILKNLSDKNKGLNFQDKSQNLSPYLQTAPSLSAGFLDLLLVTALSLLYLMTLIFTLKIDLIKSISEGGTNVWLSTSAVFLTVGFVYYVAQRMIMGFTLGEWAYEQRLGLPEEMKSPYYSLKVFWRQVLIMATGVVVIPLVSWAMGRDMGGISGLCTYRKR